MRFRDLKELLFFASGSVGCMQSDAVDWKAKEYRKVVMLEAQLSQRE